MMPRRGTSCDRRSLAAGLAIAALTLAVYAPVRNHGFVHLDDFAYVAEKTRVLDGLSWRGALWALRSFEEANWHPLTWLSHMADVTLFGKDAGAHHLVNLGLHTASTLVLLAALCMLTGAVWRSALVAAVFALHPLHVESVAWVAERKDVLSTLFLWLALAGWAAWVRRRGTARYLAALAAFALGLAAKPMVVSFPVLLLLLDWWPLGRAGIRVREKLPFFGLALCSAIVTLIAQGAAGQVVSLERLSLPGRIANALAAYLLYAGKALVPLNLACFYPLPAGGHGPWLVAAGALFVAGASWFAWYRRRDLPFLTAGWGWFLVGLLPVIGLVQVGEQSMADRYTYAPLVGLALVPAWGLRRPSSGSARAAVVLAAVVAVAAFSFGARRQVGTWRDSATLFEHAVRVTRGNWKAHLSLGNLLFDSERTAEAIAHYREARRLVPKKSLAAYNLGRGLVKSGALREAEVEFRAAIALRPEYAEAHNNLGAVLLRLGSKGEALFHLREALRLNPANPRTYYNLGELLQSEGRNADAAAAFREAVRLDPSFRAARARLTLLGG